MRNSLGSRKHALARIGLTALALGLATAAMADSGPTMKVPADVLISGGTIYDGSGGAPFEGDVVIREDRVVAVTHGASGATAAKVVDARGLAVAPGFINMLSWSPVTLLEDGRGMSDILQGVTLEVMGEGASMGPLTAKMTALELQRQGDIKYPITWTTLGGYLDTVVAKGVSPNVASFVGAGQVRVNELGEDDVQPTPEQLARMRALVHEAMTEGAMGVASSLIYAPDTYAKTPELIALATEAGKCGGIYISHMRSEGDNILPAVDELIEISRKSGAPAEIFHLKLAGKDNWGKLDTVVSKIEAARREGLRITTDMYTYAAGATGLDASMPTWVQSGGYEQWAARLKDPAIRARVATEMKGPGKGWENLYHSAGTPEKLLLIGFKNPALKQYTGKTLAEVARLRGTSPEDTAMDLVIADGSRVGTAYFMMDEANVRRQVALPWMSFGSDAGAPASEGVFLQSQDHPRAYGNFARLLGRYVRDEKMTTLESAVHRLTTLPATNLGLKERGALRPGYFADLAIFDPKTIRDNATFDKPAQYATGMRAVFVNGVQVVRDGEHTGAKPGRVVRGPGWKGWTGGGACK